MAYQTRSDFTGLTDQYLDTSAYNLDPNFQTLFLHDPKELDQRRLRAYKYYMDFYNARHWEENGEFNPAFGNKSFVAEEYNRRTWNLSRNIIDKLITFMVKEPWSIKLPKELEVDEEAAVIDAAATTLTPQNPSLGGAGGGGGDNGESSESDPSDNSSDSGGPPGGSQPVGSPGGNGGVGNGSGGGPSAGQDGSQPGADLNLPGLSLPEQQDQTNPIADLLEAVWEANDRDSFSYKLAYMGCITGDVFIKVHYDEDFYADGMGELKFTVLDSRTVQPFFDDMDRDKLIGVRIQYPVNELQSDGSTMKRMYREVHTDSNIVYLLDDEIQSVAPNPLGEIMVVHIKNEPLPFERFGRSDLYDMIIPQKEYNEKLSDLSEILAYHAAPVTIIKGARVQNLEKGARKVWGGIPKDGDVFNLELTSDLQNSLEYIQRLKTHMHETGSVPEEVLSTLQNVSNTSGSAMHLQYQPIVDRIGKKRVDYGIGLKKINRIILRFYEAVGVIDLPEDVPPAIKYKTTIEWGDALPRDRSLDLADISTEIGLGLESKKGALKRLGEENPEAKLEEIKLETIEQAEMDFMMAGIGGFGDPMAGQDGMGGTAAGANDGTQNDVSGAVNGVKTNPAVSGNQTSVQAVKKSAQQTTGANKAR